MSTELKSGSIIISKEEYQELETLRAAYYNENSFVWRYQSYGMLFSESFVSLNKSEVISRVNDLLKDSEVRQDNIMKRNLWQRILNKKPNF